MTSGKDNSGQGDVMVRETIDPCRLDNLVNNHPLGTIYHSSPWQRVIQRTYGYNPLYHTLESRDGAILAVMPSLYVHSWLTGRRIVSYPFSDSCDPLVSRADDLELLMAAVDRTRSERKAAFYELRLQSPELLADRECTPQYFNYHLSLSPSEDDIFRSFHKNCIQRQIEAAGKAAVETRAGASPAELADFYKLHTMTRRRQGTPVQPFRFFKNLVAELEPRGMLRIFTAYYHEKCVAAIIVLRHGKCAYYKYGASNKASMRLRANQLIMWEAIRWAKVGGCECFDFGRTSTSNIGLNQYKKRWGSERVPLRYMQFPAAKKMEALDESSVVHHCITAVMSRLPAIMIRLIGEVSYKHLA